MPSDNFNRADAGTLGANWTDQYAGLAISGNNATGVDAGGEFETAWWNANTPSANHYSEITIGSTASVTGFLIGVRMTPSGSLTEGMFAYLRPGQFVRVYKIEMGTLGFLDEIESTGTIAIGEVWRFSVTGTSYTVTNNGVPVGSPVTDSTFSTGTYGFGVLGVPELVNAWAGDDVAAGGGNPQIPFLRL